MLLEPVLRTVMVKSTEVPSATDAAENANVSMASPQKLPVAGAMVKDTVPPPAEKGDPSQLKVAEEAGTVRLIETGAFDVF